MTKAPEVLLCKDCVHATRDFVSKVMFYYGELAFYCKLATQENEYTSLITGKTKISKKKYFCSSERRHGDCGSIGKNWQPKKKKDLFKLLRRDL